MYMYYFLVYCLNNSGYSEEEKEQRKKNTFLLALGMHFVTILLNEKFFTHSL